MNTPAGITDVCINTTATGALNLNVNRTLPCFTNDGRFTIMSGNTYTVSDAGTYGGVCIVESGATLNITDAMNDPIISGDTLVNDGNITLPAGRGLVFGGPNAQALTGDGTITCIIINNGSGVSIPGTQTLSDSLILTEGNVTLGDGNLTVQGGIRGGDSTSFVIAPGPGYLGCPAPAGIATRFPVGPTAGSFSPVTVTRPGGSGAGEIGVSVAAGLNNPVAEPAFVDCEYTIRPVSGSSANTEINIGWNSPADEGTPLDLSNVNVCVYNGGSGAWVSLPPGGAATCVGDNCTQVATGFNLTTDSVFTVAGASAGSLIVSAQTGNWNTGSTWVGGVVPTQSDSVIIKAGHTVQLHAINDSGNFYHLEIESTGELSLQNNTTITGLNGIINNGTITFDYGFNNNTHVINTDIVNNGTITHNGYFINSTTGATITNSGIINLNFNSWGGMDIINANGGTVNVNTVISSYPTDFINQTGGALNIAAGGDIIFTDSLSNSGTVDAIGTIRLNGGSYHFDGGTFGGSGYLHMNAGAIIDAPNVGCANEAKKFPNFLQEKSSCSGLVYT